MLANAGEWPPKFIMIFLAPGEDAGIGHRRMGQREQARKLGNERWIVVSYARCLFSPGEFSQNLIVEARRCADEIGAILGPEQSRDCLIRLPVRVIGVRRTANLLHLLESAVIL